MAMRRQNALSDVQVQEVINAGGFAPMQRRALQKAIPDYQFAVVAVQEDRTTTTTPTADTYLIFNLLGGGETYAFRFVLHLTCDATGGFLADLDGGTATAAAVVANYEFLAATTLAVAKTTALATDADGGGAAYLKLVIDGTITTTAGGTLILRTAQSASSNTSSILRGSWGECYRLT